MWRNPMTTRRTLKTALTLATLAGCSVGFQGASYAARDAVPGNASQSSEAVTFDRQIVLVHPHHARRTLGRRASHRTSGPLRFEDYLAARGPSDEALALAKLGGFSGWLEAAPYPAPVPADVSDAVPQFPFMAILSIFGPWLLDRLIPAHTKEVVVTQAKETAVAVGRKATTDKPGKGDAHLTMVVKYEDVDNDGDMDTVIDADLDDVDDDGAAEDHDHEQADTDALLKAGVDALIRKFDKTLRKKKR